MSLIGDALGHAGRIFTRDVGAEQHRAAPGKRRDLLEMLAGPAEVVETQPIVGDEVKYTTCYMCACRCGIKVHIKDGRIRYIEGNKDHPVNRGVVCGKGSAGIITQHSPGEEVFLRDDGGATLTFTPSIQVLNPAFDPVNNPTVPQILAPDASLTEIVAEINAALDWLAANGPAHGINGKVVLSGWSAGGHLTAQCLSHKRVSAGLAVSGVFELGPIRDTYLNDKMQFTDSELAALSPLRLPMIKKPLAITYGTAELPPLVADSRALHEKRAGQHLPGPLFPVASGDHFTITHELRDADGTLTRQLLLLA